MASLRAVRRHGRGGHWVHVGREQIRNRNLFALDTHARRLAMRGDMRAAPDLVLATLGADPVSESVVQLLIELHFVRANASAAKRTYLEFYERSMDVLGVEPWEELQAMVAPLISGRRPGRSPQRLRRRGRWEWVE